MVDCLQCGTSNLENARYCKSCGTKITNQVRTNSSFHVQVLLLAVSVVLFIGGIFLVSRVNQNELVDFARGASLPAYGPQAAAAIIERYVTQAQWDVVRYPDGYARVQVTGTLNTRPIEIQLMLNVSSREMYPVSLVYGAEQYPPEMIQEKLVSMFQHQRLD